ncbi:MAG TPA: asparagine--tRNA ligase [Oligoflexia bacterium]|nr:asparagine--tRNA ligase [Oligoflexia bacterium]HMP48370.1 asparagine--tRNA ligase [Oligoflexia bacterium]
MITRLDAKNLEPIFTSILEQNSVKNILSFGEPGKLVKVEGWVRTRRDSKGISFVELNDGSCLSNLQLVIDIGSGSSNKLDPEILSNLSTGASLIAVGELRESPGAKQGIELGVSDILVLGPADPETYPLQKKRHSNEFLRTIAHLRPRTNTFGAVFRLRSLLQFAIHEFFNKQGFTHLHSPIITASDCEGAGAMFQVTTLPLENLPTSEKAAINYNKDFFGKKSFLTVSGQLEAELFALALKKVYTFGPTFRAENSNTPRHLAEFWMIEPEMAFCNLAGNMSVAEALLKYVISYALENASEDMEFFDKWIEPGIINSLKSLLAADYARITYDEAITALSKSGKTFEFPCEWGADIQTEHERYLTEEYIKGPVFVTNYPKEIKAFYMRLNDDGRTVAAMDLLVPRLGEIIGGSQREERLDVLKQRLIAWNLPEEHYWWYLESRKFGSVPHAGFGLGFERLLMYMSGISNVRDSIPFPRVPGSVEF